MDKLIQELCKLKKTKEQQVSEIAVALSIAEQELDDIEMVIANPTTETIKVTIEQTTSRSLYTLLDGLDCTTNIQTNNIFNQKAVNSITNTQIISYLST